MSPFLILAISIGIILLMILVFRINAFLALFAAALTVSLLGPGDWGIKVSRVSDAFGAATGKIGIIIIMAAVIGVCMLESGAAAKIVRSFCRMMGEKRFPIALAASGFILSIPVFYDTVFYLLVPLAKSFYRTQRRNYMLCLMSICAGAMITHTMVPPTPGPLQIAISLNVPVAQMILIGLMVGICVFPFGVLAAYWIDWYLPHPVVRDVGDLESVLKKEFNQDQKEILTDEKRESPSLFWSLLPVVLPVLLIAVYSTLAMIPGWDKKDLWWVHLIHVVCFKDTAMMVGAGLAVLVYWRQKLFSSQVMTRQTESALRDAAMIILITAAGGAFGKMLEVVGIGDAICALFKKESDISGISILLAAFAVASLMKLSLGSSTTAMMTTAAIFGSLKLGSENLGFNLAYLGLAISGGSLITSWMNDSGFWITSRMAGISETDTLKSVSVLHIVVGFTILVFVLLFSTFLPLTHWKEIIGN